MFKASMLDKNKKLRKEKKIKTLHKKSFLARNIKENPGKSSRMRKPSSLTKSNWDKPLWKNH